MLAVIHTKMQLRKILLAIGVTDTIVNNLKNTVTDVMTDNEIMIGLKIVQDSDNCNCNKKKKETV
ncbi:MAG TPA: hypothetical protein VKA87_07670 [Nitrososphaeraceae archaeon]|nr:hypothetical protein [Nitrososphaeraceae archaeon]